MKRFFIKRTVLFLFLFIIMISVESILNVIIYDNYFIQFPFIEIGLFLIILSPIYLFKNEVITLIYASIIFILFDILLFANLMMDYSSNDIFSIKYILYFKLVFKVISPSYINYKYIVLAISYLIAYIIFLVFYIRIKNKKEEYNKHIFLPLSVFTMIMLLGLFARQMNYEYVKKKYNKYNLYDNMHGAEIVQYTSNNLKRSALSKYGVLTYSICEINSLIYTDTEVVNDYFEEPIINEANVFTGSLENYNVLEIMIETGAYWTLNETLTPTLYKLSNEGINLDNNYSKNKTIVSEFIGINGSATFPLSKSYSNIPYSLPNMLNNEGYYTTYIHDNYSSFYTRNSLIPSEGFTNYYFFEDLYSDTKWGLNDKFDGNYKLDSEFVKENMDLIVPKTSKPFYTFYTTLSTHGPYNTGDHNIELFKQRGYYDKITDAINNNKFELPIAKYKNGLELKGIFRSLNEYEEIEEQIYNLEAAMMDLDYSISLIINDLKMNNLLDNTLIITYGDHEAYYASNNMKGLKYYISGTQSPYYAPHYKTIMNIYNPKLNELYYNNVSNDMNYNYFTSPYILVPTILDLLGIKYDTKSYIGKSIFSEYNDQLFYSHEAKMVFNNKMSIIDVDKITWKIEELDDEYINSFIHNSEELIKKTDIFDRVYSADYFDNFNYYEYLNKESAII